MTFRSSLFVGAAIFALTFLALTQTYRFSGHAFLDNFGLTRKAQTFGGDFFLLYDAANQLRVGEQPSSNYPPLAVACYVPFTYLGRSSAHTLFAGLIVIALFLTVYLSVLGGEILEPSECILGALLATVVLYHTYWFQFELERGNSNTVAAALCAAGLLCLSRNRMLMAVALIAAATQWRIYPAILSSMILLRGGFKPFAWFCGVTGVGFFALGIEKFMNFKLLLLNSPTANLSGSHSLAYAMSSHGISEHLPTARGILLALFVLFFVGHGLLSLRTSSDLGLNVRRRFNISEAALIGIAFQMMDLLPSISYDYKLGIQLVPFLIMISREPNDLEISNRLFLPCVAGLSISMAFLSAPGFLPKTNALFANLAIYTTIATATMFRKLSGRT